MKIVSMQDVQILLSTASPNFYLIDVREPEEYEAGHLPNALLMPWHTLGEKISGIPLDKELILYCETGVRAQKAAHALEQSGHTRVSVYKPGWEEWERLNV